MAVGEIEGVELMISGKKVKLSEKSIRDSEKFNLKRKKLKK